MHFTQQSALAVVVLASTAFAAPIETREAKGGKWTGMAEKGAGFAGAVNGLVNAGTDVVNGVENLWQEVTTRDLEGNLELVTREPKPEAKGGKWTGMAEKGAGFAGAVNGLVNAGTDVVNGVENLWQEVTTRDILDDIEEEVSNAQKRDIFDEMNAEYDRTIGARDVFDEMNDEYDRYINSRSIIDEVNEEANTLAARDILDDIEEEVSNAQKRDIFDEMNAEYDRTIGARDVFDDMNAEYDHYINSRSEQASKSWHEVTARDLISEIEFAAIDARSPGLFTKKPTNNNNNSPADTTPANKPSTTDRIDSATNAVNSAGGFINGVTGVFDDAKSWWDNHFGNNEAPPSKRAVAFSA